MSRVLYPTCEWNAGDATLLKSRARRFIHVTHAAGRSSETQRCPTEWFAVQFQPGIFDREFGSGYRELREAPAMLRPARMHKLLRLEVPDLGGDPARKGRRVECGDACYGGIARDQIIPKEVLADSIRRDDSEPGDYNPATSVTQRFRSPSPLTASERSPRTIAGPAWVPRAVGRIGQRGGSSPDLYEPSTFSDIAAGPGARAA